MKRGRRSLLLPGLSLPALLVGLLSCGLQEHPQMGLNGGTDPGVGPTDYPPAPPAPGGPAPAPGSSIDNPATPPSTPPSVGNPSAPPPGSATPPSANPTNPVSPPAAPGAGIMINGTFVPKEKAIAIIHWGHSNMFGRGRNPADMRPFFFDTQPGLWSFRGNGRFVAAREKTAPASDGGGGDADLGGPGMAILRTLAAAAPAGGGYQFISIGRGQTSATTEQYLKGGLYYSTFVNMAMQLKGKVTFGGVFIMMGITDRHMPVAQQSGFADRMSRIVADIRADLGEPNLPILHTDYEVTSTGSLAVNSEYARRIRPLMLTLPDRVQNLVIVPCDAIPLEDDHHFTLVGHKLWAERAVGLMGKNGWFPWAPAPTP